MEGEPAMNTGYIKVFVVVAVINVALLYTFVPDWWRGVFVGAVLMWASLRERSYEHR